MDDILSLLVVVAIYLIAVSGKSKKKAQKRARSGGSKMAYDAPKGSSGQTQVWPASAAQTGVQKPSTHAGNCQSAPLHLHDVPQSVMSNAAEGEDPCHAGGVYAKDEEAVRSKVEDALNGRPENDAFMQDMLRGVIMSEILTRPCDRRAAERNRRGYHG